MTLQHTLRSQTLIFPGKDYQFRTFPSASVIGSHPQPKRSISDVSSCTYPQFSSSIKIPLEAKNGRSLYSLVRASRTIETSTSGNGKKKKWEESSDSDDDDDDDYARKRSQTNDPYLMDAEERREWRRKIREVVSKLPDDDDEDEELDEEEKMMKMQKLLEDYPLVMEDEDPDWPEDAEGRGFNLDQFFNKITIKNVKKDDDEDDDKYESDNEIVWKDDNYIVPIKDITSAEWEETVFKDISPLIVLVHNRYKRLMDNETIRDELEKAVHIIWNSGLPSPRCVAIDAVVETDLVSALKVSKFPELIFTKAGKILYREKAIRSADEFSKIMAYFYYGAGMPPCLNGIKHSQELIPSISINN